jgi:hypothetical protein
MYFLEEHTMSVAKTFNKHLLLQIVDELPEEQATEVYLFALFLKERSKFISATSHDVIVKTLPAAQLKTLVGTVAWGGDAVEDSERLYEL